MTETYAAVTRIDKIQRHWPDGRETPSLAAAREAYDESGPNYVLLLANGADKSTKDKNGKRAFDLVAKSLTNVRAVLK
jgi:hypothetical protein